MNKMLAWLIVGVLSGPAPAAAASLVKFDPQGTVATVTEVNAEFSEQVVPFGDSRQPAPMKLTCADAAVKGSGRWLDDKRWVYVFEQAPTPGVMCKAELDSDFRTLAGDALKGQASYEFRVGGPYVQDVRPYSYGSINEDQVFVLQFNGKVDTASLLQNTYCQIEGLGEAVPVREIEGEQRKAVLDAQYFDTEVQDESVRLLQCQRRLPARGKLRLVVGPGVQSLGADITAVSDNAEHFDFSVRRPFLAEFSCQRENATADCTPVSGVQISFTTPIAYEEARKIRLRTPTQEIVPSHDEDSFEQDVTYVWFEGPFPEKTQLTLSLPEGLKDDGGRELVNAERFPLSFKTAAYPALVKFAASPFGVVERFAEAPDGGSDDDYPAVVPVTVRNVESALSASALSVSPGTVHELTLQDDIEVLRWYSRLKRLDWSGWSAGQVAAIMADREPKYDKGTQLDIREFSVLRDKKNVVRRVLPGASGRDLRPFEVVGVPLSGPGFHVLEIESGQLGRSLLDSGQPMYVRTGVLVTNLAVHIKKGRDDLLVWVTTLDEGKVVPDAKVTVLSCDGTDLASGTTGVHGAWHLTEPLHSPSYCSKSGLEGIYVSARIPAEHPQARGKAEFSFAFSSWDRGIEPWRFNVPVNLSHNPTLKAHTVFDRTLLRAGETLSMKHFIRSLTRDGFALPAREELPGRLVIEHDGSGQEYEQDIEWEDTPSGGLSAKNTLELPKTARLGSYSVSLRGEDYRWHDTGSFRVEEFVLPLLTGNLQIDGPKQEGVLIAPTVVDAAVQLSYVSGGAAAGLDVQLSAVSRDMPVSFQGYDAYEFSPPYIDENPTDEAEAAMQSSGQHLFLDKAQASLDNAGGTRINIDSLPKTDRPQQWLFEASFRDPNGQVQTLSQMASVWPAAVQAGIRVSRWVQVGQAAEIHAVALSPSGEPMADTPVVVTASSRTTYSTRKRLVGGFYSYDSHTQTRTLGKVCEGKTDARGALVCQMELNTPGEIQFNVRALDGQGRASVVQSSVWVTGGDELWFGGESADRIDLIPDKRSYVPGDVAEFQVRMPFRQATALLAVEREGVLAMQVVELEGNDPTVRLNIRPEWGPNVYVSVLVLRGRLRQTPWHSFFSWGWQRPGQWYRAFRSSSDQGYAVPTAFIDLAKPAFRHGVTEVLVSDVREQLSVDVVPEKQTYRVRETADVNIRVALPDGTPAANATVAFAAVDQALLELSPNLSWDLLNAMRQRRRYGVSTATTQLEVIGRRHYGRKALPAGGGGGKSPTRELLDTLLLWQPEVQLDEHGRARIQVPLNDSITQFALVAIADHGVSRFGVGKSSLLTTQDLQVIGGIPALVREGDSYQAMVTVRNTTSRFMQTEVMASYQMEGTQNLVSLPPQTVGLAAGAARAVHWSVQAPMLAVDGDRGELQWQLRAIERNAPGGEQTEDALRITQTLIADVPVRARQATLLPLEGKAPIRLPISFPEGALRLPSGEPRGDLRISLRSRLVVDGMPGVKAWFATYPYTCTEQLFSKAIGMRDIEEWQALANRLPDLLDDDGLLAYFPGMRQGNEVLTAYVLSAIDEARSMGLPFTLPNALEQRMLQGLQAFAQGRITRMRWSPQRDLDLRKLVVIEALSRYQLASVRLLDSIRIEPNRWPVSSLLDWMQILQRMPQIKNNEDHLRKVETELRSRLLNRGTQVLVGDSGPQASWWLMHSRTTEQARLLLAIMEKESWAQDIPRLVQGLLAMQTHGSWRTTTENLLSSLALEKFSLQFERMPVEGQTSLSLGGEQVSVVDWQQRNSEASATESKLSKAWPTPGLQTLYVQHEGSGRVWVDIRARAAVPHTQPVSAGLALERTVTPIYQATPGQWSIGDVYRVQLLLRNQTPGSWIVVNDPIPAGSTILGSGLGRDSAIAAQTEVPQEIKGPWPTFVERGFDAFRAYYEYLPTGEATVSYTVRLGTAGTFQMPGARAEALYQPDVYGALPDGVVMLVRDGVSAPEE